MTGPLREHALGVLDEPATAAVMTQRWSDIVWVHWPVALSAVARVLPDGLEPDVLDGRAWVGLVPFAMGRLRLRRPLGPLSRLSGTAAFGEVNVRTYARDRHGRSGVWFCTLDADSLLGVATARATLGLPYRWASTHCERTGDALRWSSRRRRDGVTAGVDAAPLAAAWHRAATDLERFLVERYALFSVWRGRLLRAAIQHQPWTIVPGHLAAVDTGIVGAAGFSVAGEPLVHLGRPVEVTVHAPRWVR